jgi:hypothetical protein
MQRLKSCETIHFIEFKKKKSFVLTINQWVFLTIIKWVFFERRNTSWLVHGNGNKYCRVENTTSFCCSWKYVLANIDKAYPGAQKAERLRKMQGSAGGAQTKPDLLYMYYL